MEKTLRHCERHVKNSNRFYIYAYEPEQLNFDIQEWRQRRTCMEIFEYWFDYYYYNEIIYLVLYIHGWMGESVLN